MDSINWIQLLVAMAAGTLLAGSFMVLGMWLDKRREDRRLTRELDERPPLPVRIPKQRKDTTDDGA